MNSSGTSLLWASPVLALLLFISTVVADAAAPAADYRAVCDALNSFGIKTRSVLEQDGSLASCRSRPVAFGTAQPVRASLRYDVFGDRGDRGEQHGAIGELRLTLAVHSHGGVQEAYARLRSAAQQVFVVATGEPLPDAIGDAIMIGALNQRWNAADQQVTLRKRSSGGGSEHVLTLIPAE